MAYFTEDDIAAAANPATSAETLELLALDSAADEGSLDAYQIAEAISQNPSTPAEALAAIASMYDEIHEVAREWVIDHPNVSKDTFRTLLKRGYEPTTNPTLLDLMDTHNVNMKVATLGWLNDFTDEQFNEWREASDEWVTQALDLD